MLFQLHVCALHKTQCPWRIYVDRGHGGHISPGLHPLSQHLSPRGPNSTPLNRGRPTQASRYSPSCLVCCHLHKLSVTADNRSLMYTSKPLSAKSPSVENYMRTFIPPTPLAAFLRATYDSCSHRRSGRDTLSSLDSAKATSYEIADLNIGGPSMTSGFVVRCIRRLEVNS